MAILSDNKKSPKQLLKEFLLEMTNITGNKKYALLGNDPNLSFYATQITIIEWANLIKFGLSLGISTAIELHYKDIVKCEQSFLVDQKYFIDYQPYRITPNNPIQYQSLLSDANTARAIQLCEDFVREAHREYQKSLNQGS